MAVIDTIDGQCAESAFPGRISRASVEATMKLCLSRGSDGQLVVGRVEAERVVFVDAPDVPTYLDRGGVDVGEQPLNDVRLLAPVVKPPSVRDFYTFAGHARRAMALRGREVPSEWFSAPRFYFSNPASIIGPDDAVTFPAAARECDYELELAAIVGADGGICAYTVMNDWSARDLQREEMAVGLGPVKGKDFATSLGPWAVSADEIDGVALEMIARVNGEERSRGNTRTMHYSWHDVSTAASRNTRLWPGDILGSGTVDNGCILEDGDGRWLKPGDIVELEIERIGVLRNTVAVVRDHAGAAQPLAP